MQSIMTDLPPVELLQVSGADTHRFLQGQLSCDLQEVAAGQARPGVYCNVKGRVIADLVAMPGPDEETVYLRTGAGMAQVLADALAKFIVFFKAEATPVQDQWRSLGLWGEEITSRVADAFGEAPQQVWQCIGDDRGLVLRLPGSQPRFECWLPAQASLPQPLADVANVDMPQLWHLEDIRCGRVSLTPELSAHYTPQILNFDINGAVNFRKGCFPGQEVVARMYYRGVAKKRTYRAVSPATEASATMTPVRRGEEKPVGEIISACDDGEGNLEMLVVLPCSDADAALGQADTESGLQLWDSDSGKRVDLAILPFAHDTQVQASAAAP